MAFVCLVKLRDLDLISLDLISMVHGEGLAVVPAKQDDQHCHVLFSPPTTPQPFHPTPTRGTIKN